MEFVRSGRAIELALLWVALEAVVVAVALRLAGRTSRLPGVLATLAAGAALLAGMRAALAGADPIWIALALIAALFAHGVDLALRLRRPT